MIKIALLGFGTVGQGAYEILNSKKEDIADVLGEEIEVVKILKRNLNFKTELPRSLFTDSFDEIAEDDEIKLVCEMTGDIESSYRYIKESLMRGKHAVTANKGVVSEHFEEFLRLAEENDVNFLYESAVAGSVPIIDPLKKQTVINEISKVRGILNGTSNYILYKMTEENREYSEVLKQAQEMGYAEADPYDDVEGIDALRKLRILATIAFKGTVENSGICHYGLGTISKDDIMYLKKRNKTVKLVAQAEKYGDSYMAVVEPVILSDKDRLSSIADAQNLIEITGENYDTLSFEGGGAGKLPTGNAVVTDIVDALIGRTVPVRADRKLVNINDQFESRYYLRISKDADVSSICSSEEVFENFRIVKTEKIKRSELEEMLKDLDREDYFFARYDTED